MPAPAAFDDAAAEAFLSGRPLGAGELGPLAAFADDVRAAVDGPPPAPTAAMATLLTKGISTPTGATRATLAPTAGTRGAAVSKRRKPMLISELLAGLLAKLAGLGAASKAALGLGVAAASVTGAGAAGILPDPAQHAVATAVSAATPFELPDPDGVVAGADDSDGTDGSQNGDDTEGDTGGDDADTAVANHGACVSEVAHNAPRGPGGEHGRAVSEVARSDCGKSSTSTTTPGSTTTTTSVTTTTIDGDDEETSVDANRGRGGPGSGGNPHQGNSGPGNSGNGNSGPGNSGNGGNGNSGPGNSGGGQGSGRAGR